MSRTSTLIAVIATQLLVLSTPGLAQHPDEPGPAPGRPLALGEVLTLFSEDFESGAGGWTLTGSWAIASASSTAGYTCYESEYCGITAPGENYPNDADDWLISPPIVLPDLPRETSTIKLSFWEWYMTEQERDYRRVEISPDGGATWIELHAWSNLPYGVWYDWAETVIDLSVFAGETIIVGFHFTSDSVNTQPGWWVDDVSVRLNDPGPLEAVLTSFEHRYFPRVHMDVAAEVYGAESDIFAESDFDVYENGVLQDFDLDPPAASGDTWRVDLVYVFPGGYGLGGFTNYAHDHSRALIDSLVARGVDLGLGLCHISTIEPEGRPVIERSGILTLDPQYFKLGVWSKTYSVGTYHHAMDALYESAHGFMFRPGAERIFVLVLPYGETPGLYSKDDALAALLEKSITTFVYYVGLDLYPPDPDFLEIAEETGGASFYITVPMDAVLDYVSEDVLKRYAISYTSSNPAFDASERSVQVFVTRGGDMGSADTTYVPGSTPWIQRTESTLALHEEPQEAGVGLSIEADITDEVPPYLYEARVYYRTVGDRLFSWTGMDPLSGDTYYGDLPGSAVKYPGVEYYITATDRQSTGSDPTQSPGRYPYQLAVLPNEAPTITHTPVASANPGSQIVIRAAIVDVTNGVESATLFYRRVGQLDYQSEQLTEVSTDQYEGVIPATYVTQGGVEYYLHAEDDFGVGASHGTPDRPHLIEGIRFVEYIPRKLELIDDILSIERPFFGTSWPALGSAENEIRGFVDGVRMDYEANNVDAWDLEAVARLTLTEEVAQQGIIDGIEISSYGAKALKSLTFSAIVGKLVGWAAGKVDRIPFIGHSASRALQKIEEHITSGRQRLTVAFSNGLKIPEGYQFTLTEHQMAKEAAEKALQTGTNKTTRHVATQLDQSRFGAGIFETVDNIIHDVAFVEPMEYVTGSAMGGALGFAQYFSSPPNLFDDAARDVTDLRSAMTSANDFAKDAARFTNTVRELAGYAVLIGSAVAIVAGIFSAIFTSGAGLLATLAGLATFMITYGSVISKTAAIVEGAGAIIYVDFVIPAGWVSTSASYAFGANPLPADVMVAADSASGGAQFASASPDRPGDGQAQATSIVSAQVRDYYSRLRDLMESGDPYWATVGMDSLNLYQRLAWNDEERTIAEFLGAADSAVSVINGYEGLVNGYIVGTAAREFYAAGLEINAFLYAQAYDRSDQLANAIATLDSTIINAQRIDVRRAVIYDSLAVYDIPIPTTVGVGRIEEQPLGTSPARAEVEAEIVNYGSEVARGVLVYPFLDSEGSSIVGDTIHTVDVSGGDTVTVKFEITTAESSASGLIHVRASATDAQYYTLPAKSFWIDFESASPTTPGTLSNDNIYAYPNPYNPGSGDVTLRFRLAESGLVRVRIYDVSNRLVATVVSDLYVRSGTEEAVRWDGRNDEGRVVANGVYFYVIESNTGEKGVGKIAVLR